MLRAVRPGFSTVCARIGRPRGVLREPARFIDLAERAAPAFLLLDGAMPPDYYAALRPALAARRESLPVRIVESPFPYSRVATAELSSRDRGEARVALVAATDTLHVAAELGADFVLVHLGEVRSARASWPPLRRAWLRRALADDDAPRERFLRERRAGAAPHLDAARRALDALANEASRSGLRLGVRNPARALGLPSPLELRLLLDELAGAPVVPALDAPAAHLADAMGLVPLDETLAAFGAAPVALLADACGPVLGLPPGRGELDLARAVARLPKDALLCYAPQAALAESEVLEGMEALRRLVATGS